MKLKTLSLSSLIVLFSLSLTAQNVGINPTGAAPNASAMLDVSSTNKGVLIPRVALSQTTSTAPITAPTTSLLVYNTATINDVTPGYYYWNGSSWARFFTGNQSNDWALTGNAGTNPSTNFLGTTDAQDLVFRTSNSERIRVESGGNVGIGITTIEAKLHVYYGSGIPAVKGEGQLGPTNGYLGVQGSTDFDGITTLDISGNEIGVIGVSTGASTTDNYGVYGHSNGWGGKFEYEDGTKYVELGGSAYAARIVDGNEAAGRVLTSDASGNATWQDPAGGGDEWLLLGNAGTNPSTNFLGTTDAQALVFRTNNSESMRLQTDGTVSIGTPNDNASNIYNRVENTNSTNYYALYNYHYGSYTGSTYALYNYNNSSTNNTKYGIYNNVSSTGTGGRYGIYNNVYQNSLSTTTSYGIRNYLSSYGSTSYALHNYNYCRSTTGYGIYNYNYAYTDGDFYGSYGRILGTGDATIRGDYQTITNTGTGNHYYYFADMASSNAATKYGLYVQTSSSSGSSNAYAIYTNSGQVRFNASAQNWDVQMQTLNRTHALFVDADNDVVKFGLSTSSLTGNGTTPTGTSGVIDYVADFDRGGSYGTAVGIGSVEYLFDQSSETMISNRFSPTRDGSYTLGKSTHRWNALYATNGTIQTSDENQKKNITTLNYGLNEVLKIRPISFEWKEEKQENVIGDVHLGFSAQDLLQIVPEVVQTHEMICVSEEPLIYEKREVANLGVYYAEIIPILVRALQEEDAKVEGLKAKVNEQEEIIEDLQSKYNALLKRIEELEKNK